MTRPRRRRPALRRVRPGPGARAPQGRDVGLTWADVAPDVGELTIDRQLQRVGAELLHRETKTAASDATLPLPDICTVALDRRRAAQTTARGAAGPAWHSSDLIFTTRYGRPTSRATSTASGTGVATRPGFGGSPSGTRGGPVPRSWRTWMFTPGWRCGSSGTPSSPSPWRSTRWSPRRPPRRPQAARQRAGPVRQLLLHFAVVRAVLTKTAAPRGSLPCVGVGRQGLEP